MQPREQGKVDMPSVFSRNENTRAAAKTSHHAAHVSQALESRAEVWYIDAAVSLAPTCLQLIPEANLPAEQRLPPAISLHVCGAQSRSEHPAHVCPSTKNTAGPQERPRKREQLLLQHREGTQSSQTPANGAWVCSHTQSSLPLR